MDPEPEVDLVESLWSSEFANVSDLFKPVKRDKFGKLVYFGYMDEYFRGTPPKPEFNWVFRNDSKELWHESQDY
jgi:hypothetical protein